MRRIVEYPTTEGKVVRFEVETSETELDGLMSSGSQGLVERANETFEHVLDAIKPGILNLVKNLS